MKSKGGSMRQSNLFALPRVRRSLRLEDPNPLVILYGADPVSGRSCGDCVHLRGSPGTCEIRMKHSGEHADHLAEWGACSHIVMRRGLRPVARRVRDAGPARARREHGGASHEAAETVEKSGSAREGRQVALARVRETPGYTSLELAAQSPGDEAARLRMRALLQRRLPELRDAGILYSIPAKGVRGRGPFRWYPVERGR